LRQALFYPQIAGFGRDLLALALAAAVVLVAGAVAMSRTWRRAR